MPSEDALSCLGDKETVVLKERIAAAPFLTSPSPIFHSKGTDRPLFSDHSAIRFGRCLGDRISSWRSRMTVISTPAMRTASITFKPIYRTTFLISVLVILLVGVACSQPVAVPNEQPIAIAPAAHESKNPTALPTSTPTLADTPDPDPTPQLAPTPVPLPTLANIVESARPSIVLITTEEGRGTGFVFDNGWILTNSHVVGRFDTVNIQIGPTQGILGEVVGRHKKMVSAQ